MIELKIKPLSVNQAWQGKRFKTEEYKKYENDMLLMLPKKKIDNTKMLQLNIIVMYSSVLSDIDNFLKPFLDILQKKYSINDKNIYRLVIDKVIVKKNEEGIRFEINYLN